MSGKKRRNSQNNFRVLRLGKRKCTDRKQVNLGRLILVVGVVFVNVR